MKIAILAASMDSGGAERVCLNLAMGFAQTGAAVDVVLVRDRGELRAEIPPDVRVVDLRAKRALTAVPAFRDYLKRENPDAVLAINYEVNLTAAVSVLGLQPRPLLLLSVHSAPSHYVEHAPTMRRFVMSVASRLFYRQADWVVAVSNGVATDLKRLQWCAPENIATIYNPVLRSDHESLEQEPIAHRWLHDRSAPLVVAVGRLTAAKDYPLMLRAFARLLGEMEARLLIIGDGELRPKIEEQIRELKIGEYVELAGFCRNPLPFIRGADLFVLSSAYEGFGNVLVEALGSGTAIVSTDCPHGPSEILGDGRWGDLCAVGDEMALYRSMTSAIKRTQSSSRKLELKERARAFSIKSSVDRYLNLMKRKAQ